MNNAEKLKSVRSYWLSEAMQKLSPVGNLKQDFQVQLEHFFDLLEESVNTANPNCMYPVLQNWANSQTRTDVSGAPTNLTQFVNRLFQILWTICHNQLTASQLFELFDPLMYSSGYVFETVAQLQLNLQHSYTVEQIQQQKEISDRIDKSKSAFIAIAAHELRTPLTLIEGYLSMMEEVSNANDQYSALKPMLSGIDGGVDRLRTIINDMIDVSTIENGLLDIHLQPVWLRHIFESLISEFENHIKTRKQKITIHPFDSYPHPINADPARLMQLFRNLLSNAIKFTPDGGTITINSRLLPGFIEITITDSGIGIAPDYISLIFEKFGLYGNTMLHSSGKTKFKGGGPGLGLFITKGIVEAHGGTIWAESPGFDEANCPGTTMHILLPIKQTLKT